MAMIFIVVCNTHIILKYMTTKIKQTRHVTFFSSVKNEERTPWKIQQQQQKGVVSTHSKLENEVQYLKIKNGV